MHLRPFRSLSAFALTTLLVGTFAAQSLAAGAKDKDAQKLLSQAMDEDYLSLELDKAESKLQDALKKCGSSGCSPALVGKLHIALGTIYGAGNKLDKAKEEFSAALAADPKAELDPVLTTPQLQKAYDEAKADSGGSTTTSGGSEPAPKPTKAPGGDIPNSNPIAEQTINTPVPIYIEIPEEYGAEAATLKYKPFGATSWKTLNMKRMGDGFAAEVPCSATSTTGDLKYYIIAKDGSGDQVGQSGTLKAPYKVSIKHEIDSESPAFPGQDPPNQCASKEDCPPGLPGCPDGKAEKRGDKGWGATCEDTLECKSGFICLNGSCEEGSDGSGGDDEPKTNAKKNIVGLSGSLDLLLINGGEDVCSGKDPSYVCFQRDTNKQFYGKPTAVSGTNDINGGFGLAGGRLVLSYDRLLSEKIGLSIGGRIGYAFGGQPTRDEAVKAFKGAPQGDALGFLPLHLEGRLSYSFGKALFEEKKIRPYVLVGGGVGQVSGSVPVDVCNTVDKAGAPVTADTSGKCKGKGHKELTDAYQVTGLGFIELGGGAVYAITPNVGVSAELKVLFMVPTFGVVFEPTIGPVFAF